MSLKSTIILATLLACIAVAQSNDCAKACTMEYNPICASNGNEFRLFGNPCQLEVANCEENSVWTKAHSLAACQADTTEIAAELNCEKPCTFELNPVCGFNGEKHDVFSNLCEMENAHCKDGKTWFKTLMTECYVPYKMESDCTKPCTREYKPVCGFNGDHNEIFNNVCELSNAHCNDGKAWFQTSITDCFIPIKAQDNCRTACTLEYNPVCGSNGKVSQIFGNLCALKNAHCDDGKIWSQTRMEECIVPLSVSSDCTTACTREYKPVCGFNGEQHKLFNNPCEFNNAHCEDGLTWSKVDFTDCLIPASFEKSCETPCTREYMPVCGFNGERHEVFSNTCEMKNAHCKDGKTWSQAIMASCLARASLNKLCEKPCTRELMPVCGFNGERHQVFSNKCVMGNEHCKDNKQWSETRFADCQVQQISAAKIQKPCETPCTREYNPVCGFNGKTHKVFGNKCVMNNEHCKDGQTWFQTIMSDCEFRGPLDNTNDCPQICPLIYAPICAVDGNTYYMFSNLCEMEVANCNQHTNFQTANLDDCKQTSELVAPEKDCPQICSLIFDPICALDGNIYYMFSNLCEMEKANCNQHTNFQTANLDDCKQTSELVAPEKDCPQICPLIFDPICALDGNTYYMFSNLCEMEKANCNQHTNFQTANLDDCKQTIELVAQEKDCPEICPAVYEPTCGFDGSNYKFFTNPCAMEVFNCNEHANYHLNRLSDCQA